MEKISKKTILKIAVSFVLLAIILFKVDKKQLIHNISMMNPWFIPVIVGLIVLNYFVSSVRWKKLLIHSDTSHISIKYLTSLYFIGSFFNNFLPTSVGGDVYKVVRLGKKLGSTTDAFTATFMERFTGVVALVCISSGALIKLLGIWGVLIFLAVLASIPVGYIALGIISKKIKKLQKIYDSISVYRKTPKVLLIAFLTSFVVQLCSIFAQYFVFASVGAHLSPFYAMFIFPIIILAGFFIPSLNGVGVQDALYIQLIAQPTPGITADLALSASVLFHLLRLGVSLIGGALYALNKD
jgi:glycosyltransferase 2 family protein